MANIVNRLDGLDLDAGLAGYQNPLAARMTTPLAIIAHPHPTFAANDLDDLGRVGGESDRSGEDHSNGLARLIRETQVVGNHAAIKVNIGVLIDRHVIKL